MLHIHFGSRKGAGRVSDMRPNDEPVGHSGGSPAQMSVIFENRRLPLGAKGLDANKPLGSTRTGGVSDPADNSHVPRIMLK